MSIVRLKTMEVGEEKQIITSLVISDKIANELIPTTDEKLFELNASKIIFRWIKDYWDVYKEAPKIHIQDLFNKNRLDIPSAELELVEAFLAHLSREYQEQGINEAYALAEAKKYLRKKHLCNLSDQIKVLAEAGEIDEAESKLESYGSKIYTSLGDWVFPFDDRRFVNKVFTTLESDGLFRLGGALDEIVGPIRNNYLMLIIGPMKSGKTWGLMDIAMASVLQGRNTAYINFEMPDDQIGGRLFTSVEAAPTTDKLIIYPVFDCLKNQRGQCSRPENKNTEPKPDEFDPKSKYEICDHCRFHDKANYHPAIWFVAKNKKGISRASTLTELKSFGEHFGKRKLAIRSYPPNEISCSMLAKDLKSLGLATGWYPEVIITDYMQIMASEEKGLDNRGKMNSSLLGHKKLGWEFKAAIISGWQGTRESTEADTLHEKHTSEDIRALQHTDIVLTINQTDIEKEMGVARIGCLENRHMQQAKYKQALALQNFDVGKFMLDSIIIKKKKPKTKKKGEDSKEDFDAYRIV